MNLFRCLHRATNVQIPPYLSPKFKFHCLSEVWALFFKSSQTNSMVQPKLRSTALDQCFSNLNVHTNCKDPITMPVWLRTSEKGLRIGIFNRSPGGTPADDGGTLTLNTLGLKTLFCRACWERSNLNCRLHRSVSVPHSDLLATFSLVQFSSVIQSCPNLCDPMNCSTSDSLSITNSGSLLKLMPTELVMPSNHLVLCHPLLLPPSIFPIIRIFSNDPALRIRWPKYWSFNFNNSPSNEHSGLIFRMDWLDLLAVQGNLESLLQHHSSEASICPLSAFFIAQFSWLDGPLLAK